MLKVENNRIFWCREGEVLQIDAYGPDILRVRSNPGPEILDQNWTLLPAQPAEVKTCEDESGSAWISNGKIRCEISRRGRMTFYNSDGKVLLKEEWTSERDLCGRYIKTKGSNLFRFETQFFPNSDEHFYGMGQEAHDVYDLKGCVIDLCEQNTKATVPFVVSSRGYGFLWNNPGIGRVEFGTSRTRWVAESSQQMDYLVIAGDSMMENVRKFAAISGYAPEFPEWATGLWQSKLRYRTQEELLNVAREYHKRNIPLSMIVCDFFHWTQQGEWKFDSKYWPDPAAMMKELDELGIHFLLSIWPTVDAKSENFRTMKEQNMLIRTERGNEFVQSFSSPEAYIDTTNPKAREFVWNRVRENYYPYGIRHYWLDEAEPEFLPYEYDNLRLTLGNGEEVSCLYPYYYAKLFHDGLKAEGETEIMNLIRSAYTGIQRFGVVLWSGDIPSTFESMRRQIKAGMNLSMCSIPWWTTDIGGFHGGNPEDPAYQEVMVRWFQFGAFCPVFRMHGNRYNPNRKAGPDESGLSPSGGNNELWSFGEEAYGIMKKYVGIRENLRPYIAKQFALASKDGTPITRPLVLEYADEACFSIFDQYMFGPDLMVCPVYNAGQTTREVYLPAGSAWRDAYTGTCYTGGQRITADCPLSTIPLYIRDGGELTESMFK